MRLNSPQQVQNGRALLRAYGSWQAVREASKYDHERGVLVVARQPSADVLPDLANRPQISSGRDEGRKADGVNP